MRLFGQGAHSGANPPIDHITAENVFRTSSSTPSLVRTVRERAQAFLTATLMLSAVMASAPLMLTTQSAQAAEIYIYENNYGQKLFSDRKLSKPGYRLVKRQGPRGTVDMTAQPGQPHARHAPAKSREPFRVRAKKFDHFISWAARSFELEPALIKAVIHAESAFDHNATSHAGAQGLMQLMPATGRSHGVTNPYNPHQNIMGGSKHLRYLMDKYDGNLELVLAAYNAGEVPVRKYNGIPPYKETQQYVKRVIKFYERYSKELAS